MVSGLVTSPCDQLRIFSGDARLIRIASKSATGFAISNGLERNMFLRFPALTSSTRYLVASTQYAHFDVSRRVRAPNRETFSKIHPPRVAYPRWFNWQPGTGYWELLLIRCYRHRLLLGGLDQFHIQAKRLQFANQHVERFRHARLHRGLAFDDGLVDFGASVNVVRLRREQLLQDERRAICFQSPDFHLSEALASKLRLATQRLLCDQRVRPDGTRMNLVVHQVRQLQHVDVADGDRLFENLARHAVTQTRLARGRQSRARKQRLDFRFPGAVEYGGSHEYALLQRRS